MITCMATGTIQLKHFSVELFNFYIAMVWMRLLHSEANIYNSLSFVLNSILIQYCEI